MTPSPEREFDITVLGATGWTATMCTEHITKTLPSTLRWCIAGRSRPKLKALADRLKATNLDRRAPAIYVIPELSMDRDSGNDDNGNENPMTPLARKSRVIINGIGPYHKHSSPVVAACAENGTHYVDFSTETLWIADMIRLHDSAARRTGAIVIPAISNCSSPADLLAWLIATTYRDTGEQQAHGQAVLDEVICSGRLAMRGMPGGSLLTVLDVAESYGILWFLRGDPWILSPAQQPRHHSRVSWLSRVIGHRFQEGLGHLGTSFVAASDEATVHRSAGLRPDVYGAGFVFREYNPVSGVMSAVIMQLLIKIGILLLGIPWFRRLVRGLSYNAGSGPDREESRRTERADFKAVAVVKGQKTPVVRAHFIYAGSLVDLSAILAVEAAATLLGIDRNNNNNTISTSLDIQPGGLLTPSTLGMPFIERLREARVEIDVGR